MIKTVLYGATSGLERVDLHIPAGPALTRETCENIIDVVFSGEYDSPSLPGPVAVKTIIDIGAHVGAFALWALRKWPGASLICYEPNEAAATICRMNVPAAVVIEAAISPIPMPMFTEYVDWGLSHTALVEDVEYWRSQQERRPPRCVEGFHPSNLAPCDVLKIDAEGVEPDVLIAYPHLAGVKVCCYEYHSLRHRDVCRDACLKAGLVHIKHDVFNNVQGTDVWVR